MKYTNTIYLKSGRTITQGSNENLADKVRIAKDWSEGTVILDGSNTTAIPKREIEFIDTKVNEVRND